MSRADPQAAIFFNLQRDQALALRVALTDWLDEHLHLALSRFTIAPVSRGVNFVGFRTWRSRRYLRKHSLAHFSRSLQRGDCPSLISILGNARRCYSICRRRCGNPLRTPHDNALPLSTRHHARAGGV